MGGWICISRIKMTVIVTFKSNVNAFYFERKTRLLRLGLASQPLSGWPHS